MPSRPGASDDGERGTGAARIAGLAMLAVGATLLVGVGGVYGRGLLARDRARAAWDAQEAERVRLAANGAVDAALVGPIPAGAPVARLVIPRIALDEVIVEGVGDELNAGPGHMPATPLPGGPGNAVLSAHRDMHFRRLGHLGIGDTVTTVSALGTVRWRITGRRIVAARAPAIFPTETPTLTLTTCWPMRAIGPAPDRLLLTAEPLDAPGGAPPRPPAIAAAAERP